MKHSKALTNCWQCFLVFDPVFWSGLLLLLSKACRLVSFTCACSRWSFSDGRKGFVGLACEVQWSSDYNNSRYHSVPMLMRCLQRTCARALSRRGPVVRDSSRDDNSCELGDREIVWQRTESENRTRPNIGHAASPNQQHATVCHQHHRHVMITVWPLGCTYREFDAEEDAAREMYSQSDLWWVTSLFARDLIPPPRGHRLALDSVSFNVDTIRAWMNESPFHDHHIHRHHHHPCASPYIHPPRPVPPLHLHKTLLECHHARVQEVKATMSGRQWTAALGNAWQEGRVPAMQHEDVDVVSLASFTDSDEEQEAKTTAAQKFADYMVYLHASRALNARQLCAATRFAIEAGVRWATGYAHNPEAACGNFAKLLQGKLPPREGGSDTAHVSSTVVLENRPLAHCSRPHSSPHEATVDEFAGGIMWTDLRDAIANDLMPPSCTDNPQCSDTPRSTHSWFPLHSSLMVSWTDRSTASWGFLFVNCVLAKRTLVAALRKSSSATAGVEAGARTSPCSIWLYGLYATCLRMCDPRSGMTARHSMTEKPTDASWPTTVRQSFWSM